MLLLAITTTSSLVVVVRTSSGVIFYCNEQLFKNDLKGGMKKEMNDEV